MKQLQKGSIALILLVIIVVVLIGGGIYYFNYKIKTANVLNANDSALSIESITVSDQDNIAVDFLKLKGLISSADSQAVTAYLKNKSPSSQDIEKAHAIVVRNINALTIFDQAVLKSIYYCDLSIKTDCSFNDAWTIGKLALIRADILFKQDKYSEALDEAFDVLDLAQKIENSSDTVVGYIVGLTLKNEVLSKLQTIAESKKLSGSDKANYNQQLAKYKDDVTSHKNLVKHEYQHIVTEIDAITAGDSSMFFDTTEKKIFDRYINAKNDTTWKPDETKQMFYTHYKKQLDNVDIACDSSYESAKEDIDSTKLDPLGENYVGKLFYSESASDLNLLNTRRCELQPLYTSLEKMLEK